MGARVNSSGGRRRYMLRRKRRGEITEKGSSSGFIVYLCLRSREWNVSKLVSEQIKNSAVLNEQDKAALIAYFNRFIR